jgi:hypothetical protein
MEKARERVVMKKVLQIFLGLFGVTAIFIASLHIVLGPLAIPESVPVNATMDSEDRFYATLGNSSNQPVRIHPQKY